MLARKNPNSSPRPHKATKPPRGKLQAIPTENRQVIAGLTPELSAMVDDLMLKDADILEALRKA